MQNSNGIRGRSVHNIYFGLGASWRLQYIEDCGLALLSLIDGGGAYGNFAAGIGCRKAG
jgi:hypothetical protein